MRLPVVEGTEIWCIDWDGFENEYIVIKDEFRAIDRCDLDKFVFLTKEAAEKECERLNNGGI